MPKNDFVEVMRIVARGDAAIAGTDAVAERMRRHIEPAGAEVEADRLRRRLAETALLLHGIVSFEDVVRCFFARAEDRLHQRHQIVAQSSEDLRDFRRGGARLVLIEQGVIGTAAVADGLGLPPLERDDLLQPRSKLGEVVGRSRLLPHLLGARGRACQFLDQIGR